MPHVIITQTRGTRHRLAEWIDYNASIGFEEFHLVLDGDIDGSADLLRSLDGPVKIVVHAYPEEGDYYDGISKEERFARIKQWRIDHADEIASAPYQVTSAQSQRQSRRLHELVPGIVADRRGWIAHIDVDEFIRMPQHDRIQQITDEATAPRLRFLNFNVDTSDVVRDRPILEQQGPRWSREGLLAHPQQMWATRVKTMVRFRAATPFTHIHRFSEGRGMVLDPEVARLHHFRMPVLQLNPPLAYDTHDFVPVPEGTRVAPRS